MNKILGMAFLLLLVSFLSACGSTGEMKDSASNPIAQAMQTEPGRPVDLSLRVVHVAVGSGTLQGYWRLRAVADRDLTNRFNLSIEPHVVAALQSRQGIESVDDLLDQHIQIRGMVQQVIAFQYDQRNGLLNGAGNRYAHHVNWKMVVKNPIQIELLGEKD